MQSTPESQDTLPFAHFNFEGKRYRIFKRSPERDAPWYLYFELRKERIKRCLGSNVQQTATAAAERIIAAAKRGDWSALDLTRLRGKPDPAAPAWSTVGKVIALYQTAVLEIDDTTKTGNINCLRNALRRVYGEDRDVDTFGCDAVVSSEFVRRFFEDALQRAKARAAAADARGDTNGQQLAARVKRTANSLMNQAKSLFRPKCLAIYRRAGLIVPDLEKFQAGYKEEKFEKVNKAQFNPPGDVIIEKTLEAWKTLPDRNLFVAIGHELSFGLRVAEIVQTRESWWTSIESQPFLDATADVKNSLGEIQVRALDPYFTILRDRMQTEHWHGAPDDYILTGTETERESTFRDVSAWLRSLGWTTQKTNHALRALAGSHVAMRYGIYAASVWLRHSSVKVTESHYTHFIAKHKVSDPTKLTAKWATPDQTLPDNIVRLEQPLQEGQL